jgi:hypothetical protein
VAKEDHAAYVMAPQNVKKSLRRGISALKRQQKLLAHRLLKRHRNFRGCSSQ